MEGANLRRPSIRWKAYGLTGQNGVSSRTRPRDMHICTCECSAKDKLFRRDEGFGCGGLGDLEG